MRVFSILRRVGLLASLVAGCGLEPSLSAATHFSIQGSATYQAKSSGAAARILEKTRELSLQGKRPIVVLDIDDTLLRTAFRNVAVLRDWVRDPAGRPYAANFHQITPANIGWGIEGALDQLGVPTAERPAVQKFWADRFFNNEFLILDRPNPGAVDYVRDIRAAGGRAIYLTGRWETMRPGTELSLRGHRFPWEPENFGTKLMMKPDKSIPDLAFKASASAEISVMGDVVAVIDNEPANVNTMRKFLPGALAVWIDKPHSPNAPPLDPGTMQIRNFPHR